MDDFSGGEGEEASKNNQKKVTSGKDDNDGEEDAVTKPAASEDETAKGDKEESKKETNSAGKSLRVQSRYTFARPARIAVVLHKFCLQSKRPKRKRRREREAITTTRVLRCPRGTTYFATLMAAAALCLRASAKKIL